MSELPAVEISGLVKDYGHTRAVDGLSMRARRGQITAVLGPNGAGKTTTVEICEGYRRADAGTVRVLGLDPAADGKALRARVGVMPQSPGIPTTARAADYLKVQASFYASPIAPAMLIERLGLADSLRTPFRRLSGGQQQRLSLAAAIIGRPELIFLDEPTAGLDPQARHVTWDLIAGLRASGATVILTTHYLEEAERLADYVVIIDHGSLVAEGTPAQLTGTQGQLRFGADPGLDPSAARPGAAAGQPGQGVPRRAVPRRGSGRHRPAGAGHRDGLVRRAGRAREEPADRDQDARRHLPRADRPGASVMTGWPVPAPGAARRDRMVAAQAGLELRTLARNGEQVLLTLIIPILLLLVFSQESLISVGHGSRIDFVAPGILALAVLSTSFTGLAIGTAFERRYGVLKRIGATPLSRSGLVAAKAVTVLTVQAGQVILIVVVSLLLGWNPVVTPVSVGSALAVLVLGSAAFTGLAMLMAGTLRAEATLAAANLVYLVLLGIGGVLFPLTKFPASARPTLLLLPSGAMSDGLRAALSHGTGLPGKDLLVLACWAVAGIVLAARTFRWE